MSLGWRGAEGAFCSVLRYFAFPPPHPPLYGGLVPLILNTLSDCSNHWHQQQPPPHNTSGHMVHTAHMHLPTHKLMFVSLHQLSLSFLLPPPNHCSFIPGEMHSAWLHPTTPSLPAPLPIHHIKGLLSAVLWTCLLFWFCNTHKTSSQVEVRLQGHGCKSPPAVLPPSPPSLVWCSYTYAATCLLLCVATGHKCTTVQFLLAAWKEKLFLGRGNVQPQWNPFKPLLQIQRTVGADVCTDLQQVCGRFVWHRLSFCNCMRTHSCT